MRFGLLGPLEVVDDSGIPVELGGVQARTVLAALLVADGRVVTADALLDALWSEDPPASAAGTLQSYISRLRRSLEPERDPKAPAKLLCWDPPGYRLVTDGHDVDFRNFEHMADAGRRELVGADPQAARDILLEADRLWRGSALVEFADREFAAGLAARLEERRVAAIEDRVAADLELGRHAALAGELTELVGRYPLREALRAQLALALYRSGRQAEALRAIEDARRTLLDELGVDPGRELRDLESAILDHDPSLDRPAAASSVPRPAPPVASAPERAELFGRTRELSELVATLDEATRTTRFVVVEGEPGIGKTRLVEEAAAIATERGALALWGRAFEGGAAPAFWPWLPPLRTLAANAPASAVAPELLGLLAPTAQTEGVVAEPAQFSLVDSIVSLLGVHAAAQPIMLILDDLQWADVASLELLALVAGRVSDMPLLVVTTVRELEVGRNDAVVETLATMTRLPATRRLRLEGIGPDATAALVTLTSGAEVADELARAIYERAEGNPFFTTELARLLANARANSARQLADVPSGVRDVVRRRISLLPDATGDLLQVAAVIGRDVDFGLLASASGIELDACLDALDPAVVHRLLVSVADQPGTYRFAHALVREVVIDDISSLRRARLHLKVADALSDDDDTAEIRAEHLWEAAPIGASERAADALERAAAVATRRLAYASAIQLLERAVPLRRSLGTTRAHQEAELRTVAQLVSVLAARAGYAALLGSPALQRGKELVEAVGRVDERLHLLWAEWAGLDIACEYAPADGIAEKMLAIADDVDNDTARVLAHTAYGISRWHRNELVESSRHLDLAVVGAAELEKDETSIPIFDLTQARLAFAFAPYMHDLLADLDDPERRYGEAVDIAPGDRYWELIVMNFVASGALYTGDFERVLRATRRAEAADPDGVSDFWSQAQAAYKGSALCLLGRVDEGLAKMDPAMAIYEAMGLRTNFTLWNASRAQGLAEAGRIEEAEASLAKTRAMLRSTRELVAEPMMHLAAAALHRACGEDDACVDALQRALSSAGGEGVARRVRATAETYGITL